MDTDEEARRKAVSAAARLIGMMGASKGGKMRAKKLSAYRRWEIACIGGRASREKCRLQKERSGVGSGT